jgi:hypothetical protein
MHEMNPYTHVHRIMTERNESLHARTCYCLACTYSLLSCMHVLAAVLHARTRCCLACTYSLLSCMHVLATVLHARTRCCLACTYSLLSCMHVFAIGLIVCDVVTRLAQTHADDITATTRAYSDSHTHTHTPRIGPTRPVAQADSIVHAHSKELPIGAPCNRGDGELERLRLE